MRAEDDPRARSRAIALAGLITLAGVMWVVFLLGFSLGLSPTEWGIRPRSTAGLVGVLTSPFFHGSLSHLGMNTWPFLVLGALVASRGVRVFVALTLFAMLAGGMIVWLIGGVGESHVGASGLVFGYFGYILGRGIFQRSRSAIAAALLVVFLYGSMIWLVLPFVYGMSWEGHLGGLASGGLASFLESLFTQKEDELVWDEDDDER